MLLWDAKIETDENRARVVESNYIPLIVAQLSDTNLLAFAIPVLFNLCVDYGQCSRIFTLVSGY